MGIKIGKEIKLYRDIREGRYYRRIYSDSTGMPYGDLVKITKKFPIKGICCDVLNSKGEFIEQNFKVAWTQLTGNPKIINIYEMGNQDEFKMLIELKK